MVEVHRVDVKILTSVISFLWIVDLLLFCLFCWEGNKASMFMLLDELMVLRKFPAIIDSIKSVSFREDLSTSFA